MSGEMTLIRGMAWSLALYGVVVGYADKAGAAQCLSAACLLWLVAQRGAK